MATEDDGLRHDVEWIRNEVERLRGWRHDTARATFEAHGKELESLRGRTAALERRLTAIERTVSQMEKADELAAGIADAFKRKHGGMLTNWQRVGAFGVGIAALVSTGIQIARLVG